MDKEKIARFLGAIEKATQYIVNHPEDAWDIFRSTSRELDDELNARAWRDTLPRFATRPQAMSAGRYATYEQFLFDAGLIPGVNPVSKLAIDVTAE
jgi:putative hydroxymethylpyrimidine transport system substrate-binding protein